ncbi:MAG: response regulator transcription factor [Candidatus Woesearchaeota archaeon]
MKTILIVDDDAHTANFLKLTLSQEYFPIVANSGREALEKLKSFTPDLLLLDIRMPDVSGLEVYRQLRLQNRDIPTIFLTVRGDTPPGAHLVKPIEPDILKKKLRQFV